MLHGFVLFQVAGNAFRIFGVAIEAHAKRLDAANQEEGIEGA